MAAALVLDAEDRPRRRIDDEEVDALLRVGAAQAEAPLMVRPASHGEDLVERDLREEPQPGRKFPQQNVQTGGERALLAVQDRADLDRAAVGLVRLGRRACGGGHAGLRRPRGAAAPAAGDARGREDEQRGEREDRLRDGVLDESFEHGASGRLCGGDAGSVGRIRGACVMGLGPGAFGYCSDRTSTGPSARACIASAAAWLPASVVK